MRLSGTVLVAVLALVGVACSSSDDPDSSPDGDTGTATTTAVPGTLPVPTDECEDEPDPDDYVEGEIPPTIRPCELPTELVVHTIRSGTGREAAAGDTVIADYSGIRAEDGSLLATSYAGAVPLDVVLGRGDVMPGWDEGLVGTQAGGLYKLDIPAELAYGDTPPPDSEGIEPDDALTFIMEVRAVVPATDAADAPLDLDIEPSDGALELSTVDLEEGDGAVLTAGDTAVVHMLLVRGDNLVVVLDTWREGDPLQVVLTEGGSLPGVVEGLEGATVGTRRVITMPPELAFGEEGNPQLGLPAGRDLIVVADVLGAY